MRDHLPNGTKVSVTRLNGETVTGITHFLECLDAIGQFYTVMLENPIKYRYEVHDFELDPVGSTHKKKRKAWRTDVIDSQGTYLRERLTVL